jgi:hypothetical protein
MIVVCYTMICSTIVDVNTSRIPEEGAHNPRWPNGHIIIVIIIYATRCILVLRITALLNEENKELGNEKNTDQK